MKTVATLTAIAFAAVSVPVVATDHAANRIGETVRRAIASEGDIVTAADHRAIAAKCGVSVDAVQRNVTFTDGSLHCPDGRVVRDAETRAMSDRIGARAKAVASAALNKPEVVAAINAYADEATARALRQIREGKR